MKVFFPVSLFLLAGWRLCAQSDSIEYYNQFWRETTKDSAAYYRLTAQTEDAYHAKDYYISGKLQMEGNYSSLHPEIQEGYFTWYFESGQKYVEGNFVHGQREGTWTFWYPDGLKKQEIKFSPGKEEEYVIRWRSEREKNSYGLIEKAIKKIENKKTKPAEELLNAAIAINPYSAEAFYELGLLKLRTDRKDAGCEDLKKAKEFGFYDMKTVNKVMEQFCQ